MLAERGFTYRTGEGHLYLPAAVGGGFEDKNTQLIEELLAAARRPESLLGLHDRALVAPSLRTARPREQSHHQRGAQHQPHGLRRQRQAAGDDRVGVEPQANQRLASITFDTCLASITFATSVDARAGSTRISRSAVSSAPHRHALRQRRRAPQRLPWLERQGFLFMPNTNGLAGWNWLVTSPLSEKIFFSTCNSRSPEPLLKSSFE